MDVLPIAYALYDRPPPTCPSLMPAEIETDPKYAQFASKIDEVWRIARAATNDATRMRQKLGVKDREITRLRGLVPKEKQRKASVEAGQYLDLVYFVQPEIGGLIKIGTTTRLGGRMKEMEAVQGPLQVLGVLEGGSGLERLLHAHFALWRDRPEAEMFRDCAEIRSYIASETRPPTKAEQERMKRHDNVKD